MANITIEDAQLSADKCSGENAPNLHNINTNNVISVRNDFLSNVSYNGARTHKDIIKVLIWMNQFIEQPEENDPSSYEYGE